MEKLASRKLWMTIATIIGSVLAQSQFDKVTSVVVGLVACTYVLGQSFVDAKQAEKIAGAIREGLERGEK